MDKKEQIILAALELASEQGLGNVSMSQIADKLGIKKPSLYNHFDSKDAIISAMYQFIRENSKKQLALQSVDYGELVKNRSTEQVLLMSVNNYLNMNSQKEMISFYKLIYSQRAVDPAAAGIMKEETQKMILSTKNLFYALKVHGKLNVDDVDTAAVSFAMTVHSIMDFQLDCACCGTSAPQDMLTGYVKWFSSVFGGEPDE